MKRSIVPACILVGVILAFTGCAKPPVRGYPGSSGYHASTRTQPQAAPKKETEGADRNLPENGATPPPASYAKPLTSIGPPAAVESPPAGDYLLAVVSPLAQQAERQLAGGDLESAQTTAERAVRIDPNNADLWHLMGKIQLARGNFSQAEQLARKSNLLAKGNRNLQAGNWRIIAESLRRRNNGDAAAEAMRKARSFE